MNCHTSLYTLALSALICFSGSLLAQESVPSGPVQPEELIDFGYRVQELDFQTNVYRRLAAVEALREQARSFEGREVEIRVAVDRVTFREVIAEYQDFGRTRVVMEHPECPIYGDLRTLYYSGTSGACRANLHAGPFALRIGSEIDLEVAKKVQAGDVLTIRGKIGTMLLKHEGYFNSEIIAIVRDWKVIAGP